ncbi:hypothetical protein, partial [Pseudomonas aeruginosa]|uniref:hypothetical protein n=1 Tax=Pseudomonas aeruginosa TaxID=287 RepID=UPI003CC57809
TSSNSARAGYGNSAERWKWVHIELSLLQSCGRLPKHSRRDGGIRHGGPLRPPTGARVRQINAQRSLTAT